MLVIRLVYFISTLSALSFGSPRVKIPSGIIEGFTSKSLNGKLYDSYLSIPYAEPPVKELRFKPPKLFGKWKGIHNGSQVGPVCPQTDLLTKKFTGDEDCLHLNVYVPKIKKHCTKKLPVLVYIHGGGFMYESGNEVWYGPQKYMDFQVILVTFDYRLNVLGFFSTNDSNAYGNNGMLDQVLALKWVRKNIKHFGGDPKSVTIFGDSAGSAAVFYHLLSPLSKGLISKAICESGTAINYWAFIQNPLKHAIELAKLLNCGTTSTSEIVQCVSGKSTEDIVAAELALQPTPFLPVNWGPVAEPPGGPGFMVESPMSVILNNRISNKVPLILGHTQLEGYTFFASTFPTFRYTGREYFEKQFPEQLAMFTPIQSNMTDAINAIENRYYNSSTDLSNNDTFTYVLSRIIGDAMFGPGIDQAAILLSNAGLPVYGYVYNYVSQDCLASLFNFPCGIYCSHADEVYLQFNFLSPKMKMNKNDTKMSNTLNSLWVQFASQKEISLKNGKTWPLYSSSNPKYLELKLNPVIKNGPLSNETFFWTETLPITYSKYITK